MPKGINKIVVVGGVAAGMSAASKAKRNNPHLEVVVFEKSEHVSYGACGMPYFISGVISAAENLVVMNAQQFRNKRGLDVRIRHEALSFDPKRKTVLLRNLDNDAQFEESYDRLVIATGARAIVPPFAKDAPGGVFTLRALGDSIRINNYVNANKPQRAVIIGSGYIGLEMAESLRALGLTVFIVEKLPQVLPNVDENTAHFVQAELEDKGCFVKISREVASIQGEDTVKSVTLADNTIIACDLLIVSVGVRPNVEFARSGGVETGRTGAIAVNAKMETNVKDVYAAGDCAEAQHLVLGKPAYIPLGTTANKQGRIAGDNASGRFAKFYGIVGTAVVKVFDQEIARTGITLRQAKELNWPAGSVSIEGHSRAGYYPGAKKMQVTLIFRTDNGRLLGAQLIGGEGVAKRIDVLATALHQKMTVEDISRLDLAYAPPYSPVWDPILVAANQAVKKVD